MAKYNNLVIKGVKNENTADWKKRQEKRLEEKERQERLEKPRSKQAKIKYVEKKIEIGMDKIPEKAKKKI